jgi:hypothetical protein
MAVTAALLDALPAPFTDEVGEMYQWMKSILSIAAAQHAESFLQHRVEASVLTPARPTDGGQRATRGALDTGRASSPTGFSAHDQLSHPFT